MCKLKIAPVYQVPVWNYNKNSSYDTAIPLMRIVGFLRTEEHFKKKAIINCGNYLSLPPLHTICFKKKRVIKGSHSMKMSCATLQHISVRARHRKHLLVGNPLSHSLDHISDFSKLHFILLAKQ